MKENKNHSRYLSLSFMLTIPFILLVMGTAVLILFFSLRTTLKVSDSLIGRLGREVTTEVFEKLSHLMQIPMTLNHVNYNALTSGSLKLDHADERDAFFALQMLAYPQVSYSYYGQEDSSFYGARRNETDQIEIIHNSEKNKNSSLYFSSNEKGERGELAIEIKNFDCRTRPWYQSAIREKIPIFSDVYRHFVYKDLCITASHPVLDSTGKVLGVLGVDFRLDRINQYLESIKTVEDTIIVVIEKNTRMLVGNSLGEKNYVQDNQKLKRLLISDLSNSALKALYTPIEENIAQPDFNGLETKIELAEGTYHAAVRDFKFYNLNWQLLIFTPEKEFSSVVFNNIRFVILICVVILFIAIAFGVLIVRRILHPIDQIVMASSMIAEGKWEYPLPESSYRELDHLATSFNLMAKQLKSSFSGLEEMVRERTIQLEDNNRELIKANATKDQFFKIVAHDLRGPVGSITSYLEEAKSSVEVLNSPLAKSFEHIANGSRHVLNLLEDLLTWAMAQKGEVKYHPETIDIDELINETIAALMPMAQLKEIELIFEQHHIVAFGDKNMVKTIYRNLLSNAIKFTPNGGIITTNLKTNDRMVIVSVKDTGMGMSRDLLDKILILGNGDLKRPGTKGEKGTGLGLMVCKEFVERNQGTLGVESEEGKGSIFYFSLPSSNKNE